MENFIEQYKEKIIGVLHGFDHILIRGYIRDFHIDSRFYYFLNREGCLLKDYKEYVLKKSEEIKKSVEKTVQETKCYKEFIDSPNRIAAVSHKCNERYLNSLAQIKDNKRLDNEIESLCHPKITKLSENSTNQRQYGSFNLLRDFTCKLFNAIMNGAYCIKGFTRKEITEALIKLKAFSSLEINDMKKLLGKVTRLLSKLRAHGLIKKFPKTFKYRVTQKGQEIISRILLFKKMDLWQSFAT